MLRQTFSPIRCTVENLKILLLIHTLEGQLGEIFFTLEEVYRLHGNGLFNIKLYSCKISYIGYKISYLGYTISNILIQIPYILYYVSYMLYKISYLLY